MATLNQALGKVVAAQRQHVGLSQEALAFAAGLHRTYVSMIERGVSMPTVAVLYDLSGPLQVPPSELLRRLEAIVPPPPPPVALPVRPVRPSRSVGLPVRETTTAPA